MAKPYISNLPAYVYYITTLNAFRMLKKTCKFALMRTKNNRENVILIFSHSFYFHKKAGNLFAGYCREREQCLGNAGVAPLTFLFAFFPSVPFFSPLPWLKNSSGVRKLTISKIMPVHSQCDSYLYRWLNFRFIIIFFFPLLVLHILWGGGGYRLSAALSRRRRRRRLHSSLLNPCGDPHL